MRLVYGSVFLFLFFTLGCRPESPDKVPQNKAKQVFDEEITYIEPEALQGTSTLGNIRLDFNPKIDIVFLLDFSESMKEEIATVHSTIESFIDQLNQVSVLDYRIGVIPVWDHLREFSREFVFSESISLGDQNNKKVKDFFPYLVNDITENLFNSTIASLFLENFHSQNDYLFNRNRLNWIQSYQSDQKRRVFQNKYSAGQLLDVQICDEPDSNCQSRSYLTNEDFSSGSMKNSKKAILLDVIPHDVTLNSRDDIKIGGPANESLFYPLMVFNEKNPDFLRNDSLSVFIIMTDADDCLPLDADDLSRAVKLHSHHQNKESDNEFKQEVENDFGPNNKVLCPNSEQVRDQLLSFKNNNASQVLVFGFIVDGTNTKTDKDYDLKKADTKPEKLISFLDLMQKSDSNTGRRITNQFDIGSDSDNYASHFEDIGKRAKISALSSTQFLENGFVDFKKPLEVSLIYLEGEIKLIPQVHYVLNSRTNEISFHGEALAELLMEQLGNSVFSEEVRNSVQFRVEYTPIRK